MSKVRDLTPYIDKLQTRIDDTNAAKAVESDPDEIARLQTKVDALIAKKIRVEAR